MDNSISPNSAGPSPETPVEPSALPPEPPRSTRGLIVIALVVVGLIYAAHRYTSGQGQTSGGVAQGIGQPAPDFSTKDIHGNAFSLSELKGKVVVLNFWATWCGPCRAELPALSDFYGQYKGQGVVVVGVSDEEPDTVRPFAEEHRMNYVLVKGSDEVATRYGIIGYPTTFIIGRDGKIAARHMSVITRAALEEAVKGLL